MASEAIPCDATVDLVDLGAYERLIQREEYESAALYRDRINALKSRLESNAGGDK